MAAQWQQAEPRPRGLQPGHGKNGGPRARADSSQGSLLTVRTCAFKTWHAVACSCSSRVWPAPGRTCRWDACSRGQTGRLANFHNHTRSPEVVRQGSQQGLRHGQLRPAGIQCLKQSQVATDSRGLRGLAHGSERRQPLDQGMARVAQTHAMAAELTVFMM